MNKSSNKNAVSHQMRQKSGVAEKQKKKTEQAQPEKTKDDVAASLDEKVNKEQKVRDTLDDDVDIASYDSFPASDPPSSEMMT